MTRHVGMYRRSELIRLAGQPSDTELQAAAHLLIASACTRGEHKQETDAETGNEVCGRCGEVIDDYPDVTAVSTTS